MKKWCLWEMAKGRGRGERWWPVWTGTLKECKDEKKFRASCYGDYYKIVKDGFDLEKFLHPNYPYNQ